MTPEQFAAMYMQSLRSAQRRGNPHSRLRQAARAAAQHAEPTDITAQVHVSEPIKKETRR